MFPLNILRMNGLNLTSACIHFDIDKIQVWILYVNICTFIKELWSLSHVRISYWFDIFKLKESNLIKCCIWKDIDKLWVGIVYASNGANL